MRRSPELSVRCPSRKSRKSHDRRVVAEAVEEAVGRQIDIALAVPRRNPADRPGRDDGVEGIVLEAVAVLRFVKMQVFCGHTGSSVIARSDSDEAIHSTACGPMDCFASLAM